MGIAFGELPGLVTDNWIRRVCLREQGRTSVALGPWE